MQRLTYTWNELLELSKDGELCYYEEVADLEAANTVLKAKLAALEGQRCESCWRYQAGSGWCGRWREVLQDDFGCRAWKEGE